MIVLGVVNIPIYVLIGKVIFGCWSDFLEAVKFWLTPDSLSMFRGEYTDDIWAELKLGFLIGVCGACVYFEYLFIQKVFMN